jgi:hypothetical protein
LLGDGCGAEVAEPPLVLDPGVVDGLRTIRPDVIEDRAQVPAEPG